MVTCGSNRVVWRFHDRLCSGRTSARDAVDGRELAELAERVERLQSVGEAFAHIRLSSHIAHERAMVTGCIGGVGVATEV